jgi:hypothetical protein
MANQDDYNAKLETLQAIKPEDLKTPNMPLGEEKRKRVSPRKYTKPWRRSSLGLFFPFIKCMAWVQNAEETNSKC